MTYLGRSRRTRANRKHRSTQKRHRDLWHAPFASFLAEIAPSNFEVMAEVWLSIAPPRADFIILRRRAKARCAAKAFWRLWRWLGKVTVLEYKSPLKSSFRRGDLLRLVSYGAIYDARQRKKDELRCDELTLVLVVASITPTLRAEVKRMGWTLESLERGYARITGVMYPCYVAVVNDVCQEERSEMLRLFSHLPVTDERAKAWLSYWMKDGKMKQPRRFTRAEADEFMRQLIGRLPAKDRLRGLAPEERLAGLAPEERLAGLAPEERLAGLAPEELVANLPLEVLRGLSDSYLRTLPIAVQRKVKRRLRAAEVATKPRRAAAKKTGTARTARSKSAV
ncbi:MAG: hypothetical protein IPM54_30130 [Polyangiaceae bacterium]|nr:hypothetical protein [Polyangiaceae bacterium]